MLKSSGMASMSDLMVGSMPGRVVDSVICSPPGGTGRRRADRRAVPSADAHPHPRGFRPAAAWWFAAVVVGRRGLRSHAGRPGIRVVRPGAPLTGQFWAQPAVKRRWRCCSRSRCWPPDRPGRRWLMPALLFSRGGRLPVGDPVVAAVVRRRAGGIPAGASVFSGGTGSLARSDPAAAGDYGGGRRRVCGPAERGSGRTSSTTN